MPVRSGGLVGRVLQEVEHRSGSTMVPVERLQILEQAATDLRSTWRQMDLLGYAMLDYFSGNPSELRPESRRAMAKKSLVAWMSDPQAYRAVETLNDFTFGRGVPQPRAKDKAVQRALDEFWNDTDNKILITTSEGQKKVGRDLSIQANVTLLIFDQGKDGKVKVSLLAHDAVESAVRDEDNRLRILYYAAREQGQVWDYKTDRYVTPHGQLQAPLRYYAHWANVEAMDDEGIEFRKPPSEKMGEGKVYHLAENTTTEMAFGVPMMQRTLRWFSAYNDFMAARVDMMKAAAAFVMKRQVKGTPTQLAKMATKAISVSSQLAGSLDFPGMPVAGRAASILNENEMVSHEAMKIDSGAGNAVQDAGLLHGQIAAGSGLPKHYLGEPDANLATATALELPVLKMVESRQETFEAMYRALFDMVIKRAQDSGLLDTYDDEEAGSKPVTGTPDDPYVREAALAMMEAFEIPVDEASLAKAETSIREAYEDSTADELATDRDLSYEFSMPSPLRRMMADLVTAIQGIAQTFDPNNTNVELSRVLLAVALGEALEIDDPASLVERILPPGYVDPMIAMAQEQQQAQSDAAAAGAAAGGAAPDSGDPEAAGAGGAKSGAPMQATPPEKVRGAQEAAIRREVTLRGRDGSVIATVPMRLSEAPVDEDELLSATVSGRHAGLDALFDSEVGAIARETLEQLVYKAPNGNRVTQEV